MKEVVVLVNFDENVNPLYAFNAFINYVERYSSSSGTVAKNTHVEALVRDEDEVVPSNLRYLATSDGGFLIKTNLDIVCVSVEVLLFSGEDRIHLNVRDEHLLVISDWSKDEVTHQHTSEDVGDLHCGNKNYFCYFNFLGFLVYSVGISYLVAIGHLPRGNLNFITISVDFDGISNGFFHFKRSIKFRELAISFIDHFIYQCFNNLSSPILFFKWYLS